MFKADKFWNRKTVIVLSLVNIFVLLIISILIYQNTVTKKYFKTILQQADNAIARSAYNTAETLLRRILPQSDTSNQSIQLIKRAYQISKAVEDYSFFYEISFNKHKKHSRSSDILYFYLYSLNKTERFETALNLIENSTKTGLYENIASEAAASLLMIDKKSAEKTDLLKHIKNHEAVEIMQGNRDSDLYDSLYKEYPDCRFVNNMLVINMQEGRYQTAAENLKHFSSCIAPGKELIALIYYDNNNFKKAETVFAEMEQDKIIRDPGLLLLLADVLLYQEKYESAQSVLKTAGDNYQDYSYVPYINIEWIKHKLEKIYDISVLEDVIIRFPDKKNELYSYFIEASAAGMKIKSDNKELSDLIASKDINTNRYISNLWQLFNQGYFSEQISIYFINELYKFRKYEDMAVFLSRESITEKPWTYIYNALLRISANDLDSAAVHFHKYYELTGRWEALYNNALINLERKNYSSAMLLFNQVLQKAEIHTIDTKTSDKNILSDVYLFKSYCAFQSGNLPLGKSFLDKSALYGNNSIFYKTLESYYHSRIVEVR